MASVSVPLDLSNPRYWRQNAQMAVRDVYDALLELITNADDRYEFLGHKGRIELEVERRRKGAPNLIRVRDFADGMTLETMRRKLGRVGDRVSGMAEGKHVRGTNSRGAKDVAVLGGVTFESFAGDGRYHSCEISDAGMFTAHTSQPATGVLRRRLSIPAGTGTLVTLSVASEVAKVPQHEKLKDQLSQLVPLRDILSSPNREVRLTDLNRSRTDLLTAPSINGHEVRKDRFEVPGYPGAEAKLVIKRATRRLENSPARFREGGLLIKSRHAIHEATLFAPELEHDSSAAWFFGRLTCEEIEELWNDYDERFEKRLKPRPDNPLPIIDPMRKQGLTREHPFVKALFSEALKRLRPLVEEERKKEEKSQARIESNATRQRLRQLEREAAKFMSRYEEEDEASRDPDDRIMGSQFRQKGYSLNPPFAQLIVGHTTQFWFNVNQEVFPEISAGDIVEVGCATDDITANKRFTPLEPHPTQPAVLRTVWTIKAEKPTRATAVTARVGPITAETTVEVLASELERYAHVTSLTFGSKRYSVRKDSRKIIQVLAPMSLVGTSPTPLEITCDHRAFTLSGERVLLPRREVGVAICKLRLTASEVECRGQLQARTAGDACKAEVVSLDPLGSSIKIEIKDVDHKNQRYFWRGNVLEIAARHPSLQRYLGESPSFPGQEEKHFRLLLAEIVAEAVCARIISRSTESRPAEYDEYDWEAYYADYTRLLTEFLPLAHASQVRDP